MRNFLFGSFVGLFSGAWITGFMIAMWQHFPDWSAILGLSGLAIALVLTAIGSAIEDDKNFS